MRQCAGQANSFSSGSGRPTRAAQSEASSDGRELLGGKENNDIRLGEREREAERRIVHATNAKPSGRQERLSEEQRQPRGAEPSEEEEAAAGELLCPLPLGDLQRGLAAPIVSGVGGSSGRRSEEALDCATSTRQTCADWPATGAAAAAGSAAHRVSSPRPAQANSRQPGQSSEPASGGAAAEAGKSSPLQVEGQRHSELAQLMRLKQQQQQRPIINSGRSQELPTLQQLQHQIQLQQRAAGASRSEPSPQLQRTQQWTVAAAAMAQQRQQRQSADSGQRSWRSNAAAAPAPPPTAASVSSKMETEQTVCPTSQLLAPQPVSSPSGHQESRSDESKAGNNYVGQNRDENQLPASASPKTSFERQTNADGNQSLLTTAHGGVEDSFVKGMTDQQHQALSYGDQVATRDPVPTPRASQWPPTNQQANSQSLQAELSILTNTSQCMQNPRIKDISCSDSISSAQSTPAHSIMSDSTTLITEAAMNSTELIPKLIERLDRKLIVMKEEQLTLMREIELNETTGQRLFESMKKHLTVNEYEKIALHANEIEKVTKLILSLKLRLKRVEAELKERQSNSERANRHLLNQKSQTSNTTTNLDDNQDSTSQSQKHLKSSSLRVRGEEEAANSLKTSQLQTIRGVSDPTSTVGLPKRNHQHHASLQLGPVDHSNTKANDLATRRLFTPDAPAKSCSLNKPRNPLTSARHQLSLTNSSCDGSGSSRVCSPREPANFRLHSSETNQVEISETKNGEQDGTKTASTSSDSIFNCSDSAIGSTINGHGGSTTNIEQPAISQSSLSSSSGSSTHSSLVSSTSSSSSNRNHRRHHHHHHHHAEPNSPSQSHLSSNISVSSHSSMSSVPISPPLVSPASTTCIGTSSSLSTASTPIDSTQPGSRQLSCSPTSQASQSKSVIESNANSSISSLGPFSAGLGCKSDGNNNSSNCQQNISSHDSTLHLLTDADILIAKRNKLISQLEEAHQLEECIVHRNNIIIQRILKKYYDENGEDGEIAEFKQFTRLKSLLLKDTHDVADRIDNAELQLTELKSSQCQA